MTIDEAIVHCEEVAEEHTKYNFYGGYEGCDECAEEHRQLAEWLKELKLYREMLIDRPCEVCEFHKTGSCSRWECVFDGGKR